MTEGLAKTRGSLLKEVLQDLDNRVQDDRAELETTCLVLTLKREQHRFLDGYELALRDVYRGMEET